MLCSDDAVEKPNDRDQPEQGSILATVSTERKEKDDGHCGGRGFFEVWKVVMVKGKSDKMTTSTDWNIAKNGNSIVVPAELIR